MSFAALFGWWPMIWCKLGRHSTERQTFQWHGDDPDFGPYTSWSSACARCRRVLDAGARLDTEL